MEIFKLTDALDLLYTMQNHQANYWLFLITVVLSIVAYMGTDNAFKINRAILSFTYALFAVMVSLEILTFQNKINIISQAIKTHVKANKNHLYNSYNSFFDTLGSCDHLYNTCNEDSIRLFLILIHGAVVCLIILGNRKKFN